MEEHHSVRRHGGQGGSTSGGKAAELREPTKESAKETKSVEYFPGYKIDVPDSDTKSYDVKDFGKHGKK